MKALVLVDWLAVHCDLSDELKRQMYYGIIHDEYGDIRSILDEVMRNPSIDEAKTVSWFLNEGMDGHTLHNDCDDLGWYCASPEYPANSSSQ